MYNKKIETISQREWIAAAAFLLHGDFTNEEMNSIYNHPKVKAMISLTKGEGFGRPLLEFSLTNKPIMVSGWSGHVEFYRTLNSKKVPMSKCS